MVAARLPFLVCSILLVAGPGLASVAGSTGRAEAAPTVPACSGSHWVASWYAAPGDAVLSQPPLEQTFRIQVSPLRGGTVARFRFSNRFGLGPVTFGAATVGLQDAQSGGAAIQADTLRPIRFNNASRVVIAKGQDVVSDPVNLRFAAFQRLLVSVHVVGAPGPATQHAIAEQTTWQSPPLSGNRTARLSGQGFVALPIRGLIALPQNIPYLTGMDVVDKNNVGTVVTFGDSITDGTEAETLPFILSEENIDKFAAYPDQLAKRIHSAGLPFSVANAAISGNQLLTNAYVPVFGPSGLSRFSYDALSREGATTVIVLEGINDIGQSLATSEKLIAGYQQVIEAAHAKGLRILIGTLTPQNGTLQPLGYGALGEPTRLKVNEWIRSQDLSDGMVDFDKAVQDPADPSRIRPEYDGGDHLHFSAAGYQAMAAAVPLDKLARARCG